MIGISVVGGGGGSVVGGLGVSDGVTVVGARVMVMGGVTVVALGEGVLVAGFEAIAVAVLATCVSRERFVATAAVAVEEFSGVSATRANARNNSSGVLTQRNPRSSLAVDGSAC